MRAVAHTAKTCPSRRNSDCAATKNHQALLE
jgi:hypothetical protein